MPKRRSRDDWKKKRPKPKREAGTSRLKQGKAIRPVRASVMPQGPRKFAKLRRSPEGYRGGPGQPPPGFVSGTTSAEEWIVYWAISRVLNDPVDPRKPPYFGGRNWGYQIPMQGGRHLPGGSVPDYVIYYSNYAIVIRLQTERFHIFANSAKQVYDTRQKFQLARQSYVHVVDVYSQDFIEDVTGRDCIAIVRNAIASIDATDPLVFGLARRSRIGRRLF